MLGQQARGRCRDQPGFPFGWAQLQWQLREAERALAHTLTCCVTLGKSLPSLNLSLLPKGGGDDTYLTRGL